MCLRGFIDVRGSREDRDLKMKTLSWKFSILVKKHYEIFVLKLKSGVSIQLLLRKESFRKDSCGE